MSVQNVNIEKFAGSFSTEQGGCSVFINSTVNLIQDMAAAGLYLYLMCRPKDWKLNVKQLTIHFDCHKDKIYKSLNLLKEMGLLKREDVREKGKFSKPHYRLHLHPQFIYESQCLKGISPCPKKPDTVLPDTEKPDTYKTKNIQNKEYTKTTTTRQPEKSKSSSHFVISKEIDKKLLALRDEYLQADDFDRTPEEFLRQCSHHLDNGDKQKYNLARRTKGLETIIKAGFFETPAGYTEKRIIKSIFTPEETALLQTYEHALRMVGFGCRMEDWMPKTEEIEKAIQLMDKARNNKVVFIKAA